MVAKGVGREGTESLSLSDAIYSTQKREIAKSYCSGLPWGKDPDPGLCPLITGFQLVKGSCLPGSQEVLGGQRREVDLAGRPCQAPRGRASAEMRELKAS